MIVAASWRIIIIATGLGNLIQQKGMDHSLSLSPLSIGLQGIWYTVKAGQKLTKGHYWSGYCGTTHTLTPSWGNQFWDFVFFFLFFSNISLYLVCNLFLFLL
ncbi:hypothetical protein AAZX31_10G200400 [Glycine max]|uniref:Uncharacterized protein n=2 Tax=Glycine subgen. Soja TaxID=1462606 RepID=K7LKM6_SOYBN|nr:hypothetical protein JHK85_029472 [Glycine max]RZB88354.1 hypothetical protein D0Y65_027703 [Glycine soja]KAG5127969.1 hypothetical protein JHK82_028804 [Glycine max]KAG5152583.1 hypothetical protein JHK84_029055 [Glycine max]KAH1139355.1 hypothetical protein GYH30_028677 [Glycine max]